ncbi:DsbA family protein [uncultured Sphingomonas sp.]|uniref:DsbA family protein n=1 Tax=uncultured Sphingomonas sp. TaxID=158754 RepID=UPI0025F326EE|nr:DsbA family protein [uncultured Sphingomonas sp.]
MTIRPWVLGALLLLAGVLGGAAAFGLQQLQPAPGDVRAYLLTHPEVLPEAMAKLQERETGKLVAANRDAIFTPVPGMVGGNPNGDVTVVTYMDYACGYCRASLPEIDQLVASDKGVRIVYRELPILSADSRNAAAWGVAAAEQGKYLPFHTALFAAGRPTEAAVMAAAAKAGLDVARARTVVAAPQTAAELDKNLRTAGALGMTGTPAWVIGDRIVSGAVPQEQLIAAVKAARDKG